MHYLTVTYQYLDTLETTEKVFKYRFKWMALIHIWLIELYNSPEDPSLTVRVEYRLN